MLRLLGLLALLAFAQEALSDVSGVGQGADYAAGRIFDDGECELYVRMWGHSMDAQRILRLSC